ncbi:hypothetical protein [Lachnoanaerobaculum gingivalis]|uniref:hypothetical protein n=1 Tax=Lachnoanaerobaculum gingivalis TaxID=2490855 RepID=UPI0028D2E94C|nr:hypothetical protein [Lachnoanaerobaculum gingivalis]
MENLEIFEKACKYFSDNIFEFKETLSEKIPILKDKECEFDKGSTKVFKADETGRKKRCKCSIGYRIKIELTEADAETVLDNFNTFFEKTYTADIERISNNEELGRYEFIAKNTLGDEVRCAIYLANEWNIAQICILGYVSGRYKKTDLE